MNDSVSSRPPGVFAGVALLSTLWVACSIFIPYGFPWMGLGWVGLALSGALFVRFSGARSMAQVPRAVEAESMPGKTAR